MDDPIGVVPHGTVLCGSYWWKDILKLNDAFRLHSEVTINMGDSVLFWFDAWVFLGSSVLLRERFQRLFSFVIDDKVSVREVINTLDMSELFYLPLSPEAMAELTTVHAGLLDLNADEQIHDSWSWTPGKGIFSVKSYYTVMHAHMATDTPAKWIWESKATMKIKVFAWLMLNDRLNTRDMLVRRHWRSPQEDNTCPLCYAHAHEDRYHLFFTCQFSTRVWNYLQIQWLAGLSPTECLIAARNSFGQPFFKEVVYLAAWNVWLLRNGRIFGNERPTFASWRRNFIHDVTLLTHRFKPGLKPLVLHWINSLP